ncbi:hypothetical protein H2248_000078 [Termitomyces sp. 'cryptogamus']|nr:hypothetical protein H2248_000078 [Termitomyces sp. 'cryptogamus']
MSSRGTTFNYRANDPESNSDMQLDSDVDIETVGRDRRRRRLQERMIEDKPDDEEGSNVDIEAVAEGEGDDEEEEGDEDEEDEEEDEVQSDTDDLPKVNLKIRLKLPAIHASSRYETPTVESEDSMDSQLPRKRPLTSRQAVLANVMDPSHVSLGSSRQKKAPLNESELALRREETARKRKNLTEKKLEDEKLETINRLLKKQSRPRKKRNTAQRTDIDDIAPADITRSNSNSVCTPSRPKKNLKKSVADEEQYDDEGEDDDAMVEDEEAEEELPEREVQIPTMYRWVSTSRIPMADGEKPADVSVQMQITFSVPTCALPPTEEMKTISSPHSEVSEQRPLPRPTTCAVPGCGKPFRYRLVKDLTRGACGMSCLKQLEAAMDVTSC